jgi:hypothetical protein
VVITGHAPLNSALGKSRQLYQIVLGHRFHWLPGCPPCPQPADDHVRIEPMFSEQVRHPGACAFARSSTVQIYLPILRKVLNLLLEIVRFNPDRPLDALGISVVVAVTADIRHENDSFTAV